MQLYITVLYIYIYIFPWVRLAPGLQGCVSPLVSRGASRPWSPRGASRPLGCFPMFFLCFPMFSYWAGGSYPPNRFTPNHLHITPGSLKNVVSS